MVFSATLGISSGGLIVALTVDFGLGIPHYLLNLSLFLVVIFILRSALSQQQTKFKTFKSILLFNLNN